jgi:predicted nucleotidyltransferase
MTTENDYIQLLKDLILKSIDKEHYAVFLFGGRARGRSGKAVDFDIGFLGDRPLSLDRLAELYHEIEESSIPFKVDLVDFFSADPQFRKIALSKIIVWNKPPTIKIN